MAKFWAHPPALSRKASLGLTFILSVAGIWVLASFVVQDIQAAGAHPAVLTFIANSLFAVYLPIYKAKEWWLRRKSGARAGTSLPSSAGSAEHAEEGVPLTGARDDPAWAAGGEGRGGEDREDAPSWDSPDPTHAALGGERSGGDRSAAGPPVHGEDAGDAISARQTFLGALLVAPLWYLAQLTFNASLELTSVTSNTLLSSTAVLFTYLLSVALLREALTLRRLAGIGALMAGTAAVAVADGLASPDGRAAQSTLLGNAACLVSAALYGAYTVAIRWALGGDDRASMLLFFGCMGAVIFCTAGPALAIAAAAGARLGRLSGTLLGAIVAKGLLDNVLSDYLWARSILLIGPTLATAGLSLQMPMAVLADGLFRDPAWRHNWRAAALTALGGLSILGGFLWMTLGSLSRSGSLDGGDEGMADEDGGAAGPPRQSAELVQESGLPKQGR